MARRGKNEGSISFNQQLGLWTARVTTGYNAKGDAKRRAVYGKTREEVAAKLVGLLSAKQSGTLQDPNKMTLAEMAERYIRGKVNAAERTRYTATRELVPLLAQLGSKRLQDLRPAHVKDAYTSMASAGLSVRAQRRAAMHLKALLREAVHEGIVIRNVAEAVKLSLPRVDDEDDTAQAWTPLEASVFLEAAKDDPLYSLFYLMLALGLRRGEALGLAWNAVDFGAGTLRVKQVLAVAKDGKSQLKSVKTHRSRRTLYLSQDVLELLRAHKTRQDETRAFMGTGWQECGLVFTTTHGTPIGPRNALRSFKRLTAPLAVAQIRLHDLRHTYASLALQRGMPVEVVSERLGHSRVDMTLNIYRHLYEAERQAAALSLADLLAPRPSARAVN